MDQIGGRGSHFAAEREALQQPEEQEENGAAHPIASKDGVSASPTIAMPISVKERNIAGLRPARSPQRPMKKAPTGRDRNPIQKISSAASRRVSLSWFGKKVWPIWTEKKL